MGIAFMFGVMLIVARLLTLGIYWSVDPFQAIAATLFLLVTSATLVSLLRPWWDRLESRHLGAAAVGAFSLVVVQDLFWREWFIYLPAFFISSMAPLLTVLGVLALTALGVRVATRTSWGSTPHGRVVAPAVSAWAALITFGLVGALQAAVFDVWTMPSATSFLFGGAAILVLAVLISLSLVPAGCAWQRGSVHTAPILVICLLFGWTLIGWVIAFVWAFASPTKAEVEYRSAIAAYGPPTLGATPRDAQPVSHAADVDTWESLRRLGQLAEDGVLTHEEFAAKKAELLTRV